MRKRYGIRGLLSCGLALTMAASVLVPAPGAAAAEEPQVWFDTSFESGDAQMLESRLDGQAYNVEEVADVGRMEGDVTNLVRSDTLSGSADYIPEEGKQNLFDYNTGSKFLTAMQPADGQPVEIIFQLEQAKTIRAYVVATAADEPSRDPTAWTLYGSADGGMWTPLDSRTGITFSARKESKTFSFANDTAYTYYKLSITANAGAPMTQLSELQLSTLAQAEAEELTGLVDLDSLAGSEDFLPEEGKRMLFDHNTYTKFLTDAAPTADAPVTVSFRLTEPAAVASYLLAAGPDELGRNPKSWTLEGSQDGNDWQVLNEQTGIVFQSEQETRRFETENRTAYTYYRLVITENNGEPMTQFSELQLFAAPETSGPSEPTEPAAKEPEPFDLTSLIQPDSIEASPAVSDGEGIAKLFDYNTDSKYVSTAAPTADQPIFVQFALQEACAVTGYVLGAANDEPTRDPADWTLYGSADGQEWTPLDSRSGETFSGRQETRKFTLGESDTYRYFRLEITANAGAPLLQFSELRLTGLLPGCATPYILMDSLDGSEDVSATEGKRQLFDYNTQSKFVTRTVPAADAPVYVSLALEQPFRITGYILGSGTDEPTRDPVAWTLYGSANGREWTPLDSRSGVAFSARQENKSFFFSNETAYSYYKLEITAINGGDITQLSEWQLMGEMEEREELPASPMKTRKSRGPSSSFNTLTSTGWTGWSALEVMGRHTGTGEAWCYNVLYDNLSIPVTANTNLRYVFFPALYNPDVYDYNYTSQHMAIDLKFTDGTYLHDLGAVDQNGSPVTPQGQGEAGILAYMQWNDVQSNIGAVAAGKTIEQILVGYQKADNPDGDTVFLGYFDDITIENKAPVVYEHLSDYVNILRGTNNTLTYSRGITTPLVTMPHGFNAYSPVTESNSTLPYSYQLAGNKTKLRHMSIEHAASPWLGDYGTWQFMPNTDISYDLVETGEDIGADRRAADFTHEKEEAKAHYYSVEFEPGSAASGVRMEVTPTSHAMYARFTFPEDSANRNLIFDCERADGGLTFHGDGSFTAYSDHVYGQGSSNPNAANGATRMYIYGVIDQTYDAAKTVDGKQGIVSFPAGTGTVTMKLATSFISEEQAKKNLSLEIGEEDDFDDVCSRAQETWDEQLGIVEVEGATFDQLTTLYSSLYRLFAYPTLYAENAGDNAREHWVYSSPYAGSLTEPAVREGKMYTINGFWDTYRAAWPAYSLLTPSMAGEMLDGMLEHYKDGGWISRWVAAGAINCMVGSLADAVFGDAMVKGIDFDYESAFDAALKNSAVVPDDLNRGGRIETATDIFRGYTSTAVHEGFSWGMEDTICDYNIYRMAQLLGKIDEAAYYKNRALNYVNYYNADLGWYMARNTDGSFRYTDAETFDPSAWHEKSNWDYCETNAWNMIFSAVQDVQGMINLYGGEEAALERLDALFAADLEGQDVGMREMREVRLGQYNHTNEPSLHLSYMYAYLGQPYKTQEIVRDVLSRCYAGSSIGQGYLGDEDNGGMSGWYVFSALGFYPASVGTGEYIIGSPLFTKATIHLENGEDLVISAPENSRDNVYIQSVQWNGEAYDKTYFTHDMLSGGGEILFEMGPAPSDWGTGADARPSSLTQGEASPAPMADAVPAGVATGEELDASRGTAMAAGTSAENLSALFDNTSDTVTEITGRGKEVLFYTPQPYTVSIYTLTAGTDETLAPTAFTLYGSTDGRTWVELDSRTEETFRWKKYTRPFAVAEEKQGAYSYYRLAFDDREDIQLAEIELLGYAAKDTADILESARAAVETALESLSVSNDTAEADILEAIEAVLPDSGVQAAVTGFEKTKATETAAGSIAAEVTLTLNGKSIQVTANLVIDKLTPSIVKGDLTGDGSVTIEDVMAACRILARKNTGNDPTGDELARGDLTGDGSIQIDDIMSICRILARKN